MFLRLRESLMEMGRGLCLVKQLRVGDSAILIEIIALPVESHPVALPRLDMPVQAVVGDVCLRTHEPLYLDWPRPDIKVEPAQPCQGAWPMGR